MRSLLLCFEMLALLPIALVHPFVGVLIWDWISFMNPQQISWGIGSKLPWAVIAFVFTVVGWMVSPIEPKKITVTPLIVLMVLFVVGISVNLPFALSPLAVEYDAWLRTTKIFVFLIITAALLTNRHRIDALIWMIIISIGYTFSIRAAHRSSRSAAIRRSAPPNRRSQTTTRSLLRC